MRPFETRCPNCQTKLGLTVPENWREVYLNGFDDGINKTIGLAVERGLNADSYKQEIARIEDIEKDIAEFTGESLGDVEKKMENPEARLADLWGKHQGGTEVFYMGNWEYLYDNSNYNRFTAYQIERMFPLVYTWDKKTLDIGCGIGSLVFMLAGQKNEAWGWDINSVMIGFCNFKNDKYELGANFTTAKPTDWSDYDIISALGVFEHFENLKDIILELGEGMKKGAKLYHWDDFHDQNISPMHFDHSLEMPMWLEGAGFIEYDERWAIKA